MFLGELQAKLDYLIDEQSSEVSWDLVWTWSDFNAEDWDKVKIERRGRLTLEALTTLRKFGFIASIRRKK